MQNVLKQIYRYRLILGGILILGALVWVFQTQKNEAQKILSVLPKFSRVSILWVVALDSLQILLMAFRFWWLYPKTYRPSLVKVFSATAMGQTMNAFLPARAGDFYKITLLTPKPAPPECNLLTLTGVLAADKVVDTVIFVILVLTLGAHQQALHSVTLPSSQMGLWAVVLVVIFVGLWQLFLKKRFRQWTRWFLQFLSGLKSLVSPVQMIGASVCAVGVWFAESSILQELSYQQGYPLSLAKAFFVLLSLNLAIAIPISVANIGPFEASIAFALNGCGLPLESALAVATLHHGLQIVSYAACGTIGWVLERGLKRFP